MPRWPVVIGLLLATTVSAAQFRRGRGGSSGFDRSARFATPSDFDGGFQFCRVVFRSDRNGDGNGWDIDWPRADESLSIPGSRSPAMPLASTCCSMR